MGMLEWLAWLIHFAHGYTLPKSSLQKRAFGV
jgi:hypothetical protein